MTQSTMCVRCVQERRGVLPPLLSITLRVIGKSSNELRKCGMLKLCRSLQKLRGWTSVFQLADPSQIFASLQNYSCKIIIHFMFALNRKTTIRTSLLVHLYIARNLRTCCVSDYHPSQEMADLCCTLLVNLREWDAFAELDRQQRGSAGFLEVPVLLARSFFLLKPGS